MAYPAPSPGLPPVQGHIGAAQKHPQDSTTLKKGALVPHRADHGDTGTAERCKGSRTTVSGTRDEADPPKSAGRELGWGYVRQLPAQFTGDPNVVNLLQGCTGGSERKQLGAAL